MIISNVAVDSSAAVAVEVGGTPGAPRASMIGVGGPNEVYLVNKGATSKADPSFSFAPGEIIYPADMYGGERMWFICDTAETCTLTVGKTEV